MHFLYTSLLFWPIQRKVALMQSKRWIIRWWPLVYCPAWVIWALIAPEPFVFGTNNHFAHFLAALGAIGLICMAIKPEYRWVRLLGTIAAASYPLYRALSVAIENNEVLNTNRRIVTVSFDMIAVISLLILYPIMMWASSEKRSLDE